MFACEQEQSVMEEKRKDFLINIRHIEHTHVEKETERKRVEEEEEK